jgi:hypothetical protein
VGWEKRRFNRVPVSLEAEMTPVDIELNPLMPLHTHKAKVIDLSPTGMFVTTAQCFRTGTRFRVTLRLDDVVAEFYVIVRHTVQKEIDGAFCWGHGTQTIGATEATVMSMVRYLEKVVSARTGAEATKRAVLLPPAA